MHTQHCGHWCPGANVPGHQFPQNWPIVHCNWPVVCLKYVPFIANNIDGLVQERRNSIANALELCLSCTNPSKWPWVAERDLNYCCVVMMTSSNGNIFRVTAPLWREFTSDRWILLTKACDAELLCFLWSAPEQTLEKTIAHYYVIVMIILTSKC